MDEIRRNELEELKKFFVDSGYPWELFSILFVLEDAKSGAIITPYLYRNSVLAKLEYILYGRRRLIGLQNMLRWFGLCMSKEGGYVSKNRKLCDEWDAIDGNINLIDINAGKFFGYPKCCVKMHDTSRLGDLTIPIQLYALIKEVKIGKTPVSNVAGFLKDSMFLQHIMCNINCRESMLLGKKYETVMQKYQWLVKDLLKDFNRRKIKSYIKDLKYLQIYASKHRTMDITSLMKSGIDIYDFREILENGKPFRENIEYGKRILESFL